MFCPLMSFRDGFLRIDCETNCGWYDNNNHKCIILTLAELKQEKSNKEEEISNE